MCLFRVRFLGFWRAGIWLAKVSKKVKVNIIAEINYSTFKSDIQHDFLLPNQDKQNKLLLSKLLHSRPVVPTVLKNLDI